MKKIITAILAVLLALAGVSLISHYIKDKKENSTSTDARESLYKVNLKTDVRASELNNTSLIEFLNTSKSEQPVFREVISMNNVFKDNGGLKLGTADSTGSFTVDLYDTFTFNRAKVIGRNYSAMNNATGIYSCDSSSISVNNAEAQAFGTNADDTTQEAPTQEKLFEFTENQTQLAISVSGQRATIFTIELWTEKAPTTPTSEVK